MSGAMQILSPSIGKSDLEFVLANFLDRKVRRSFGIIGISSGFPIELWEDVP